MLSFTKKKAPLLTLTTPLEKLYDFINEKIEEDLNKNDLLSIDSEEGDILKKYIEPKVFSYVILIWGIQGSKFSKAEKQILCSYLTIGIGSKISNFSDDDGANYLRYSLLSYGREGDNGQEDLAEYRIASKFLSNMDINPADNVVVWGSLIINLRNLINMTADFLNKQRKNFNYV